MRDQTIQLKIKIDAGEGADEAELDKLTKSMMADLKNLDLESIERVKVCAPEGSKPICLFAPGSLQLMFSTASAAMSAVLPLTDVIRNIQSGRKRKIIIEIKDSKLELDDVSADERLRLIDLFMQQAVQKTAGGICT